MVNVVPTIPHRLLLDKARTPTNDIDLKTAKTLGLNVPLTLQASANEVIQ